jgi:anti-sigma regulatory factor (Ser/Thr protein kinase)
MTHEIRVPIREDADLVPARAEARALATRLGFSRTDATLIATAISEIARNIVVHVGTGEVRMRALEEPGRCGLLVLARDDGAGIEDVDAALEEGFATRGGLGLGLPGARRLMDEFDVDSAPQGGTTVRMVKWRMRDELERLRERRNRSA